MRPELVVAHLARRGLVDGLEHWLACGVLVPKQLLNRPGYERVTCALIASHLRRIG
ncbi:MAG TPA: hypothetical protein VFC19_43675 [Candidatus Limnocylindrales bacterium]|nr:hypothetical protein [Candidatus Limnocylindrales bacterium]